MKNRRRLVAALVASSACLGTVALTAPPVSADHPRCVRNNNNVRKLLDPRLRALDSLTPHLDCAPDLLRDLIRYGHAERGLRPRLTTAALAAVDTATPVFLATVPDLDEYD